MINPIIGCSAYPQCRFTERFNTALAEALDAWHAEENWAWRELRHVEVQLIEACRERDYWKARADQQPGGPAALAPELLHRELKKLITVAHPDRWCQNQPAVDLAHQVTAALNRLRGATGGGRMSAQANTTATQHFFEVLYPDVGDGYLLLSWPSPTRRHKDGRQALASAWHNLATTSRARIATRATTLSADHSVYFGVAIQHPSRQPNPFERSQNASAYVLPGLYFDIDLASGAHAASTLPATEAEALDFLHALPSQPSLILHTGGGLHGHWVFEAPLWLRTEADRAQVTHLLRQFAYTLCQAGKTHGWTLDALRDLARVLRPPGTINHKYGTPVELLEERPVRYTAADFDWLTPLPAPSVHQGTGSGVQDQPPLVQVVEAYGGTLTQKSAQEWHGAHPTHGSSTGINLDVNTTHHLWHCWRHGTGGDALSLIAVCEGLLACEDLHPSALDGARFPHVLAIAHARFGWQPPPAARSHFAPLSPHLSRSLTSTLRSTL